LDRARIGAESHGVDRDAGILCLLRGLERLVVTRGVRTVGEQQDDDWCLAAFRGGELLVEVRDAELEVVRLRYVVDRHDGIRREQRIDRRAV
jgi:hypothetical protein